MVANALFFKMNNKILKNHKFLSLGMSALMTYSTIESCFHFSNSPIAIPIAIGGFILTVINTVWTLNSEDNARSLIELFTLKYLNYKLESTVNELLPYKHKALTVEQIDANDVTKQFINGIFLMQSHQLRIWQWKKHKDLPYNGYLANGDDSFDKNKNMLLSIYQQHFKHELILANCLLKSAESSSKYLYRLFFTFWPVHSKKFNAVEIKHLEKKLHTIEFDEHCIFTDKEVFSALSFSIQEKILVLAQEKKLNTYVYQSLFDIHQSNIHFEDKASLNVLIDQAIKEVSLDNPNKEIKDVTINPQSQQRLDSFEKRFDSVFTDKKDTLVEIQELMLNKEKLSYLLESLTEKHFIESKLFLDNDVDKILKSFHKEVEILHKMQINQHPQFEQLKNSTLDSIHERISLISSKMLKISEQINESMTQELSNQINVSQTVLKAKM